LFFFFLKPHLRHIFFFNFVWPAGLGIFGEPWGLQGYQKKEVSKGKYAGRVGRQDWETSIIYF
jgi:hypothetical protein